MRQHSSYSIAPALDDASLPHVLHAFAVHQVPTHVYQVVQLCLPLAYEAWSVSLYRVAVGLVAVSALGLWALCEQRLHAEQRLGPLGRGNARWVLLVMRGARAAAGIAATVLAVGLASESFVRLLSLVTGRPGVAG